MSSQRRTHPEWDLAAYPAAEVARLVRLHPARVRRWLRGYDYTYGSQIHHQRPVVRQRGTAGTTFASFLDLVDLLFIKRFLDHGLSLQKIRKALDEATEILGTDRFARKNFFTNGRNIYLEVSSKGDALLELLSDGQWVIAPIIKQLAKQIDFDSPSGLARRWYPMGQDGFIVLDPLVSFGRPTIVQRGIATANVYDFFIAERGDVGVVSSWLDLPHAEVQAAIEFEERVAA